MTPSILIANLSTIEQLVRDSGDEATQAFVLEAQDCVLRLQRENLELRSENQVLRQSNGAARCDPSPSANIPSATPFLFQAFAVRRRDSFSEAAEEAVKAAGLVPAD